MIPEASIAARSAMKNKRKGKRRDSRPRCDRNRCTRPAIVHVEDGGWCKTHAKQLADKLARAIVLSRDEWSCQRCGSQEVVQWAHLLTRASLMLRFDPDNSLALCRACHFHFTKNPAAFERWISKNYPGRWQELHTRRDAAIAAGTTIDYAEIIASLRSQAAGLVR